jgi:hypothetical protein
LQATSSEKSDLRANYLRKSDLQKLYSTTWQLEITYPPKSDLPTSYATQSKLRANCVKKSDLDGTYKPKSDVRTTYATEPDLHSHSLSKSDLQRLYATKSELANNYAQRSELHTTYLSKADAKSLELRCASRAYVDGELNLIKRATRCFPLTPNSPPKGIIHQLTLECGGNVRDQGVVAITAVCQPMIHLAPRRRTLGTCK